jgi:hypothetical protein
MVTVYKSSVGKERQRQQQRLQASLHIRMIIPHSTTNNDRIITPTTTTATTMVLLDDDSSTSSTVTAVLTLPKSAMVASSMEEEESCAVAASPSVRKIVRFNECANEFFCNTQICSEDCVQLWYNGDDYLAFKATSKFLASQIAQFEQEQQETTNDPYSYQRILLRTHEACRQCPASENESMLVTTSSKGGGSVLTAMEDKQLRRWLQGAPMRLGLERYAIRDLGRDRYFRRRNLVQTVLHLQNEFYIHNIPITPEEQAECLSLASMAISRPSRLFSRHFAQASQSISFEQ